MQVQTIYCAAKYNNIFFFDLYPKYENGDIVLYMGSNQFMSYSDAVNDAVAGYQSFISDIQGIDNVTLIGDDNIVQENNLTFLKKVLLNINISQPSQNPDYTNVLSNINSNLSLLNTNIQNKNNQSDIVSCLNNIFCYTSNDNSAISSIKDSSINSMSDKSHLNQASITSMLRKLIRCFCNFDFDYGYGPNNSGKLFQDISRKIFDSSVSNINNASFSQSDLCTRLYYLVQAFMKAASNNTSSIVSNSLLKDISEKLANSNDLHTISQAIDLISTAIAQTPITDISPLTSAVQNLHLEQNNLIEVEGVTDYRIKTENKEE